MGQDVVDGVVGRLDPGDLLPRRLSHGEVTVPLQRELQALFAQVQPDAANRAAGGELAEDDGENAADGLVGMLHDLSVAFAPDKAGGQSPAQFAARCLVADPAVEAGAQDVQLGLRHGAFHAEQQPVVEHGRMVDAVGIGDQRVGHPGQIQQPVPVAVVAGQPGAFQRQHDPDLPEPDLGGELGEPGPARRRRARDA
jgi:hypothetical protein